MAEDDDLTVHDSCGNVFADMGMPGAEERLAKAERARLVRNALRRAGVAETPAGDGTAIEDSDPPMS
jgi:hypothetical protein